MSGLKWVPETHRGMERQPGFLNTHGSAWLAMCCEGHARAGQHLVPCDGMGTLLQCVDGAWCVVMWPSTALTSRGHSVNGAYSWLNSNTFNAQTFKLWADEHVKYSQLVHDAVLWVPYGWHYCALATYAKGTVEGDRGASCLLMQPYLSVSLANETWPLAEVAAKSVVDYLQHVVIHASNHPDYAEAHAEWRAKIPAFSKWLKGLLNRQVASKAQNFLEDAPAAGAEQEAAAVAAAASIEAAAAEEEAAAAEEPDKEDPDE